VSLRKVAEETLEERKSVLEFYLDGDKRVETRSLFRET
jgi:hypothetical protein